MTGAAFEESWAEVEDLLMEWQLMIDRDAPLDLKRCEQIRVTLREVLEAGERALARLEAR